MEQIKKVKSLWVFLMVIFIGSSIAYAADNGNSLTGSVRDNISHEVLEYASVALMKGQDIVYSSMTDPKGNYTISNISTGTYVMRVTYVGYDTFYAKVDVKGKQRYNVEMKSSSKSLNEVVVTATESKNATSSSRIDVTAMKHLQPSSFTDLLELLPGGKSTDPSMGTVNSIKLREASPIEHEISSLGVGFVIDGVNQNTDANLQSVPNTYLGSNLTSVSKGVDMRAIPTDNIESVEIVRGIPSVAYGNITSGTVIINRIKSETPFTARFKSDQDSKMLSAGKGFRLDKAGQHILNVDFNYLDAKVDPTNSRQNYTRFTTSFRLNNTKDLLKGRMMNWNVSADYTGSFDKIKRDKDATIREDAFRSKYNSLGLAGQWQLDFNARSFLKQLKAGISLKEEWDIMKEIRSISLDRSMAIPTADSGEAVGIYLPYQYVANMEVDGRPFYMNANASALFRAYHPHFNHNIHAGIDWNFMKNYGDGQVYDTTQPMTPGNNVRPRKYSDIPSLQNLSIYAEDDVKASFGRNNFDLTAGVRLQTMPGLSSNYAMKGKFYADPRFNLQWRIPMPRNWSLALSGGLGWMTRMPTQAQLFPQDKYVDLVELNYYTTNAADRSVYFMTYKWNDTNYDLKPARNRKWEIRTDMSFKGNRMSITYFREHMNNAFGQSSYYKVMPYKTYSNPTMASYVPDTLLDTYNHEGNDVRVRKQGVEFQFTSKRIEALMTRITINGAWLKTIYSTKATQYKSQSIVLNNKQLQYVGLYNWEDGDEFQSFNTNFMLDTYLKRLGMTISLSSQCTWFTTTKNLWNNGTPIAYVDQSGTSHVFTEADKKDTQLQHLVTTYSSTYFDRIKVPFAMDINLKATKDIGKYLNLALFVNRIVSAYPSYHQGTQLIRRSSTPYFGMEANFRF